MQSIAIQRVQIDGYRGECRVQVQGFWQAFWKIGWPLVFVVVMTLLSEFGPRTVYSKLPPAQVAASQPAVHAVK